MKTLKQFRLQHWLMLMVVLPLCCACNDEEPANNSESPINLGIKIAVLDKDNSKVISELPTVMPGVPLYWHDDTSKGMNPDDYTLKIYMDGKFLKDLTNPTEQIDWPVVNEPGANGCPWWTITLSAYHAGESMLDDDTWMNSHEIEYHMQCQKLFGDEATHVIRFEYQSFWTKHPNLGYYANVYFDDKKMDTYYPELYKVSSEQNGITLDIDNEYWMEGAVGWPVAVITLGK